MPGRMDHEKAARRDQTNEIAAARRQRPAPNRKTKTTGAQRAKLVKQCELLGREPTFPTWAYDASVEIDRLQLVIDFKRRRGLLPEEES